MKIQSQSTLLNTLSQIDHIPDWANEFYKAKKAEGISPATQVFYKQQLSHFLDYCAAQIITHISQITAPLIRDYLLWLADNGHNPGGCHAAYRVLKTFLRWYDLEMELENWRNPITKVKAPRLTEIPLDPVPVADVLRMAAACDATFLGKRDKAIILFLLDTGVRARELLKINIADVDIVTGMVLISIGKGRKTRQVVCGRETRKALRSYLKNRHDPNPALWVVNATAERLHYPGLRNIIRHRAKLAGIPRPALHDFRRAFAINMLRRGVDLATLAELTGHTSIKVLKRYLKFVPDDLQAAHALGSPVDHAV